MSRTSSVKVWVLAVLLVFGVPCSAKVKQHRTKVQKTHRKAAHARWRLPGVVAGGPWMEPTFADSTDGDRVEGEDPLVRYIARQALGPYNGSVVVVDSSTGRILSILNQKLALKTGFQPCSTFKVPVALAALSEQVINPGLTDALAHSSNYFFANLGRELGFEKVSYYAHQFGYGEKAGLNIPGEEAGHFPLAPPANGGVDMLTSFGEEVSQTPLQLAALMSAIANGGTLYSLQYPRSAIELSRFRPEVKRKLSIESAIPGILPGLLGAVDRGTARSARQAEPIAGKTGTCSENHAHLGWFGAFNNTGRRLVVVVLLRGGRQATGPRAAGIAGEVYRELALQSYLVDSPFVLPTTAPAAYAGLNGTAVTWALVLLGFTAIVIVVRRTLNRGI